MSMVKHVLEKKSHYKWAELFNESQHSIQDKYRPDKPTITNTPEIVDSVNATIFAERSVTIEDISVQLGILHIMTSPFLRSVVIGFHQNNAIPHITTKTVEILHQFCWEQLP